MADRHKQGKNQLIPRHNNRVEHALLGSVQTAHSLCSQFNEKQQNYFEQYKRVLEISFQIHKQIILYNQIKLRLELRLKAIQKNMDENNQSILCSNNRSNDMIKKRNRRGAEQIQRKCKCNVEFCEKQYGTEGSLIQHVRLKHPELFQARI